MPCKDISPDVKSRRMRSFEGELPEGVPPLLSLYMYISGSCNLTCKHCWIKPDFNSTAENGNFIEVDHIKKAIREAKSVGLHSVKLTGGEPLLHPRIRDIVTFIDEQGIDINIETNGTLINRDMAKFLSKKKAVLFISISLDSIQENKHDDFRGVDGSYKKTVQGIKNLADVGIRPQIICTLYDGNRNELGDLVEFAENNNCCSLKFNHVQQIGHGKQFHKHHGLKIQDIIQLNDFVEKELVPSSKLKIVFDIPYAFHSIKKMVYGTLSRCTVLNILGMLSSGEYSLCGIGVNIPELVFGHVEQDDIQELWKKNSFLLDLRDQIPLKFEGICGICLHRDICMGTCIANNYFNYGKLNSSYYFCQKAEFNGLFPYKRKKLSLKTKENFDEGKKDKAVV